MSSEANDHHVDIVREAPVHILENDDVNFESNVLAEEKAKLQGLQKLQFARTVSENEMEASHKIDPSVTTSPNSLLQVKEETKDEIEEELNTNEVQQQFFKSIVKYPVSTEFQRVLITKTDRPVEPDTAAASAILLDCMQLRNKWLSAHPSPPQDKVTNAAVSIGTPDAHRRKGLGQDDVYRRRRDLLYDIFATPILPSVSHLYTTVMRQGIISLIKLDIPSAPTATTTTAAGDTNITVTEDCACGEVAFAVLPFEEFVKDMNTVKKGVFFGPTGSYSFHCLEVLSAKFHLHTLLNSTIETEAQKLVPHRDFYNIRKVDTHVHHSACMNQKHLLRFIKNKLKTCPNEVSHVCVFVYL